jgi:hypothetical protein
MAQKIIIKGGVMFVATRQCARCADMTADEMFIEEDTTIFVDPVGNGDPADGIYKPAKRKKSLGIFCLVCGEKQAVVSP